MLRKMINLPLFAAAALLAAHGVAHAECASCTGSGYEPVANCPDGSCSGHVLGGLHHGYGQCGSGGCLTCESIWDDYCATKRKCLHTCGTHGKCGICGSHCGGQGLCSGCCNTGDAVGIYGKCSSKRGIFHKLFKHHHRPPATLNCDVECGDGDGAAGAYKYSVPTQPVNISAPAGLDVDIPPAPMAPLDSSSAGAFPQPSFPPMPASARTTRSTSSGAFGWLQDALKMN